MSCGGVQTIEMQWKRGVALCRVVETLRHSHQARRVFLLDVNAFSFIFSLLADARLFVVFVCSKFRGRDAPLLQGLLAPTLVSRFFLPTTVAVTITVRAWSGCSPQGNSHHDYCGYSRRRGVRRSFRRQLYGLEPEDKQRAGSAHWPPAEGKSGVVLTLTMFCRGWTAALRKKRICIVCRRSVLE